MKSYHKEDYFIFKDQILFNLFILTTLTNTDFPRELILYINTIFLWLSSKKTNFINTGEGFIILKTKDELFGMGNNAYGQLGLGDDKKRDTYNFICRNVISFSCGVGHLMVLKDEGLFTCGGNHYGQLGLGMLERSSSIILTKVDISNVFLVDCGDIFSYILTKEGLYSCGGNEHGQLGLGNQKDSFSLQKINISRVTTLSCGGYHILIISNGKLYGCGYNRHNQLGLLNSSLKDFKRTYFHEIDIKNVLSISCGKYHSMILTMDGLFSCGDNSKTQCGPEIWRSLGCYGNDNIRFFTKLNINHIYSFHCGSENTLVLTNQGLFMYGTIIEIDHQEKEYYCYSLPIKFEEKHILTDIIDFYCNDQYIFILNERGVYGRGKLSCSDEIDYLFKKIDFNK